MWFSLKIRVTRPSLKFGDECVMSTDEGSSLNLQSFGSSPVFPNFSAACHSDFMKNVFL